MMESICTDCFNVIISHLDYYSIISLKLSSKTLNNRIILEKPKSFPPIHNRIEFIEFIHGLKYPQKINYDQHLTIEILKQYRLDYRDLGKAILNCSMEVIDYLLDMFKSNTSIDIASALAIRGDMEIIKLVHTKHPERMEFLMIYAASLGRLQILDWGFAQRLELSDIFPQYACRDEETMRYLHKRDWQFTSKYSECAATYLSLETLKWLICDLGCEYSSDDVVDAIAYSGSLEKMQWFYELNESLVFTDWTMAKAARVGAFALVKWLKEKGCPFGTSVFQYAIEYSFNTGNLDLVMWLKENNYSDMTFPSWYYSDYRNSIHYKKVIDWFEQNK